MQRRACRHPLLLATFAAAVWFTVADARAASGDSPAFTLDTRNSAKSPAYTVGTGVVGVLTNSGTGSLRDSIAGATPGDTLTFNAPLDGATITLGGSQLTIEKDLTIDASALPNGLTVSGNGLSRVFGILSGNTVAFDNLEITGGNAGGSSGGGISNEGGNVTLSNATLSGNTAAGGGGIYNGPGTLTLSNATLSGNSATDGGALRNEGGTLTLVNATIAANTASGFGGGIDNDAGTLNIENTIVAANTGPAPGSGPDIAFRGGSVVPAGANLVGDNDTVAVTFPAGPLAGTTATPLVPKLASLGNYGGPTPTMALLAGSPAVNSGIVTGGTPLVDQRGLARPAGGGLDLGAYESGNEAGYAVWALEQIPGAADGSFTGDAESDGTKNGNEYGFKLNPVVSDNTSHPIPAFVDNGGNLEMHVTFSFRPDSGDLIYIVERTNDLDVFSEIYRYDTSTAVETITSPPEVSATVDAGAMTIEVIDRDTADPRAYWRFRVELISL